MTCANAELVRFRVMRGATLCRHTRVRTEVRYARGGAGVKPPAAQRSAAGVPAARRRMDFLCASCVQEVECGPYSSGKVWPVFDSAQVACVGRNRAPSAAAVSRAEFRRWGGEYGSVRDEQAPSPTRRWAACSPHSARPAPGNKADAHVWRESDLPAVAAGTTVIPDGAYLSTEVRRTESPGPFVSVQNGLSVTG